MSALDRLMGQARDWWVGLTARERILVGMLPFIALAGGVYALRGEVDTRIERLTDAQQELQALGQTSTGAWLSAKELAEAERETARSFAFTATSEAAAREYVRGLLDQAAVEAQIPSLTIQVRQAEPEANAATAAGGTEPAAPAGAIRFMEVDVAGAFRWQTFLDFQTRLSDYREITAWSALSFDETGDGRFRATLQVAYRLDEATP